MTRKWLIHMDTVGRGLTLFLCYLTNIQTMTTVLTIFITSYSSLSGTESLTIYCYFIAIAFLIPHLILVILSFGISTDFDRLLLLDSHLSTYESISHNFHIYSQNFLFNSKSLKVLVVSSQAIHLSTFCLTHTKFITSSNTKFV